MHYLSLDHYNTIMRSVHHLFGDASVLNFEYSCNKWKFKTNDRQTLKLKKHKITMWNFANLACDWTQNSSLFTVNERTLQVRPFIFSLRSFSYHAVDSTRNELNWKNERRTRIKYNRNDRVEKWMATRFTKLPLHALRDLPAEYHWMH